MRVVIVTLIKNIRVSSRMMGPMGLALSPMLALIGVLALPLTQGLGFGVAHSRCRIFRTADAVPNEATYDAKGDGCDEQRLCVGFPIGVFRHVDFQSRRARASKTDGK